MNTPRPRPLMSRRSALTAAVLAPILAACSAGDNKPTMDPSASA